MIVDDAQINAECRNGLRPLHLEFNSHNWTTVFLLFQYGTDLTIVIDDNANTPMHRACAYGNLKFVEQALIESGVIDLFNTRNNNGMTPLHLACLQDRLEV